MEPLDHLITNGSIRLVLIRIMAAFVGKFVYIALIEASLTQS